MRGGGIIKILYMRIDQVRGQYGWILAELFFFFYVFMDREEVVNPRKLSSFLCHLLRLSKNYKLNVSAPEQAIPLG